MIVSESRNNGGDVDASIKAQLEDEAIRDALAFGTDLSQYSQSVEKSPIVSSEEYEETCRRRFTEDNFQYEKVITYQVTGKHASNLSRNNKRQLRRQSALFYWDPARKTLYYTGGKDGCRREVVRSPEEVTRLLHLHHTNGIAGHRGQNATYHSISREYYWRSMVAYIIHYVKNCSKCRQPVKKLKTDDGPISCPKKVKGRWNVLCMDLMGPFNITVKNNKYVITMMDLFTKWVVAYPLKHKSAQSVARAIMKMVYTHGPPVKITTNKGKTFVNEVNKNVESVFGVQHMMVSEYHPQSSEQTIKATIEKCCKDNHSNWDEALRSAVYGMNTSQHTSAKKTPFYRMYLRNAEDPQTINDIHASQKGEDDSECDSTRAQVIIEDASESSMGGC